MKPEHLIFSGSVLISCLNLCGMHDGSYTIACSEITRQQRDWAYEVLFEEDWQIVAGEHLGNPWAAHQEIIELKANTKLEDQERLLACELLLRVFPQ